MSDIADTAAQHVEPELRQEPGTGRLGQRLPTQVTYDEDSVPIAGSERWLVVWCQPGVGITVQSLTDNDVADWVPLEISPRRDDVDQKLAAMRSVGLFGMAFLYDGRVLDPAKVVLRTAAGTDATNLRFENAQLRSLLHELRTEASPGTQPSAMQFGQPRSETRINLPSGCTSSDVTSTLITSGISGRHFKVKVNNDDTKYVVIENIFTGHAIDILARAFPSHGLFECSAVEIAATTPCACLAWAGDMRVPRPNGHHPLCDGTGHHRVDTQE